MLGSVATGGTGMVEPSGSLSRESTAWAPAPRSRMSADAVTPSAASGSGSARLLPGAPVAAAVLADVTARATALRARGVTPSLATLLVGDDDASAGYIRIKQRQAAELGFDSPHAHMPAGTTQDELHRVIAGFNDDPAV